MWYEPIERLLQWEMSLATGLTGVALAIGLFALSQVALVATIVGLPSDFFCGPRPGEPGARSRTWLGWLGRIGKNLGGLLLVLIGLVMAMPGVPGPGLVAIAIGVALMDFPGKRSVERRIVGHPLVLATINSLRKRFGRSPLVIDHGEIKQ
jgi:hypothetical protein